jgi:hypothetical protein
MGVAGETRPTAPINVNLRITSGLPVVQVDLRIELKQSAD